MEKLISELEFALPPQNLLKDYSRKSLVRTANKQKYFHMQMYLFGKFHLSEWKMSVAHSGADRKTIFDGDKAALSGSSSFRQQISGSRSVRQQVCQAAGC